MMNNLRLELGLELELEWYDAQHMYTLFISNYFRPSKSQIFENRSNLASNSPASNRKSLATFEPQIGNFA